MCVFLSPKYLNFCFFKDLAFFRFVISEVFKKQNKQTFCPETMIKILYFFQNTYSPKRKRGEQFFCRKE